MNVKVILLTLCFPVIFFGQKKRDKASIRPSDFNLAKKQLNEIDNSAAYPGNVPISDLYQKVKKNYNSIVIMNPNQTPIKFIVGSTDVMEVVNLQPEGIWNSEVVGDFRFNFVMKTGQNIKKYAIKNNACYSIFWDKKASVWDLKDEGCSQKKN